MRGSSVAQRQAPHPPAAPSPRERGEGRTELRKMRRELIGLVCAAILVACDGGGGGEKKAAPGDKDTLVIAFDGSPANLDPRVGTNTYDGRIWDMTAGGLIK